jgi:hypothetical protein
MATTIVTREQFDAACEAVWSEIEYQNNLPRRCLPSLRKLAAIFVRGMIYCGIRPRVTTTAGTQYQKAVGK